MDSLPRPRRRSLVPHHAAGARRFAAAALALAWLVAPRPAPAHARTPRIGGFPTEPGDVLERCSWSGAWVYPVGDPRSFDAPDSSHTPGYRVLRGVTRDARGTVQHSGVDLGNRHGGGTVRAAGNGLVVRAADDDPGGYGNTVVLAHRLPDGGLLYSVYAHLRDGSIRVREGQMLTAGQPLARVGDSGNATTEHLHFEIRRPSDPEARWERARVLDPLAFIAERLPARMEGSWAQPYLVWAQCSALIARDARADQPLERAAW